MGFQTISLNSDTHARLKKFKKLFGSKGKNFSFDQTVVRLLDYYENHWRENP